MTRNSPSSDSRSEQADLQGLLAAGGTDGGPMAQLAAVTHAGLPLSAGLRACAEESVARGDARALRRLAEFVDRGGTLEEAAIRAPPRMRMIWQIMAAGMKSGQLPRMLEAYLHVTRHNRELWRQFWISLLYPAVVVSAGLWVLMVAMVLIAPRFREIFEDFGVELPGMTLAVMTISAHLVIAWPVYVGLALLAVLTLLLRHWIPLLAWWEYVPLVRTASLRAGSAEFCGLLAVFVESGAPLHDGVRAVGRAVHNSRLRKITWNLARRLEEGVDPRAAAESVPRLPLEIQDAFRWAGEQERFVAMLRQSARALSAEARIKTMQMSFFVEPAAIVTLGGMAGCVMVALFLPIIKLLNALS